MNKGKKMTALFTGIPLMLGLVGSVLLTGAGPKSVGPATEGPIISTGPDGIEDCANPPGDCCWTCPKGFDPNCDCSFPDDMKDPPSGYNRVIWDGAFTTRSSGPCGPGGRYFGIAVPYSNLPADFLMARAVQNCGGIGDNKQNPNGYLRIGAAEAETQIYLRVYGQELGVLSECVKARAYDSAGNLSGFVTLAFRVRRVSAGCASLGLAVGADPLSEPTQYDVPDLDTSIQWQAHYISIPLMELGNGWEFVTPDIIFDQYWGGELAEVHYDDLQITITENSLTSLMPRDPDGGCVIPIGWEDCDPKRVKLICCDHWNGGGSENFLIDDSSGCRGDLNCDGFVDVDDLLLALSGYPLTYGIDDVLQILSAWGPCP